MKNKKGFTLIELLAVIVILGVLLAIAIPAVAKYINSAKKSTYVDNVQSYVKAARQEVLVNNSTYALPVTQYDATIIAFDKLSNALDNGGKTSSYGGEFDKDKSFIVIVNEGTASDPQYVYYIAAVDDKGYGIGKNATTVAAINYDSLKEYNIVQLGTSTTLTLNTTATTHIAVGSKINVSTKTSEDSSGNPVYTETNSGNVTVKYIYK